MQVKIFDFRNNIDENELEQAATVIKKGNLVIFPTETVYGIGANALSYEAANKIFIAKGRESDNPLIAHIANLEMLKDLVQEVTEIEKKLMDAFWPGPFTIILPKKPVVPYNVTAGLETVAIRMPSNKIALKLIEKAGVPIAAPSANISGKPSGTNIEDIKNELSDKVDIIIDGGPTNIGLESTVVKVIDNIPVILRPGGITPEDIKKVIGNVILDKNIYNEPGSNDKVLSPGMKYKHYSPKACCVLIDIEIEHEKIKKVKELISKNNNKNIVILCARENILNYLDYNVTVLDMGSNKNYNEISQNIFTLLRKVDNYSPDIVFIEGVKEDGIGVAIMNRLIRASGYNVIT